MLKEVYEEMVDDRLKNPEMLEFVFEAMGIFNSGKHQYTEWLDVFMQKWFGKYDLYDSYGLLDMILRLQQGVMDHRVLRIDMQPLPDKRMDKMQQMLSAKFDPNFVKFNLWGGLEEFDGQIFFNHPEYEKEGIEGWWPLEIGYTKIHTTYFHLAQYGRLARWPYGIDNIFLLKTRPFEPDETIQDEYDNKLTSKSLAKLGQKIAGELIKTHTKSKG